MSAYRPRHGRRLRWSSAIPWPIALLAALVVLVWLVVGP